MAKSLKFLVPLAIFLVLVGFFWKGLQLNPGEVPSPLIDKPAPSFSLPQVQNVQTNFSSQDMRGKVWLLNVWASWCESCREEHPALVAFARQNLVPMVGLNYEELRGDGSIDKAQIAKLTPDEELKLARQRAQQWLSQRGDPYVLTALDLDGQVGIDYGVYGVPETYVIDREGVIRHKHIGPITDQVLQDEILPIVRKLKG
jgi:cytochrome c biogenesis protein CcmG/thiol:disulfide interchange protein DsbE